MIIVNITAGNARALADELGVGLEYGARDFYIGYDPADMAIKVKIGNGVWSPPMGTVELDMLSSDQLRELRDHVGKLAEAKLERELSRRAPDLP